MTALAIEWLWWVLGTFGVAGLVAFWFLAPTAASLTFQAVVKLFGLLMSYRIGCALLAAVAAGLIADDRRHAYDDAQFAGRTAAFEAAQRQRDAAIAQETRDKVLTEIGNAAVASKAIDNDVKDFRDALPPAPLAPSSDPFLVGADAERLCHIAGKARCGPDGDQGVPKARRSGPSSGDHAKIRLPGFVRAGARPAAQGQ